MGYPLATSPLAKCPKLIHTSTGVIRRLRRPRKVVAPPLLIVWLGSHHNVFTTSYHRYPHVTSFTQAMIVLCGLQDRRNLGTSDKVTTYSQLRRIVMLHIFFSFSACSTSRPKLRKGIANTLMSFPLSTPREHIFRPPSASRSPSGGQPCARWSSPRRRWPPAAPR